MAADRILPWLREPAGVDVWAAWQVVLRDVVIVGHDNRVLAVYNLTQNDLREAESYADLRDLLLRAASQ